MKKLILLLTALLTTTALPQGDWKQYLPEYNHVPRPFDTNVIEVDRFNNIWIGVDGQDNETGSYGGFVKFDGTNWTQYSKSNSNLPDNNITSFAFDNEDNVWIGMKDSGLAILKNDVIKLEPGPKQFILKGSVKKILADSKGIVWVLFTEVFTVERKAKANVLLKYENETWTKINLDSLHNPEVYIYNIALDKYDALYFGSVNKLIKFDGENWTSIDMPGDLLVKYITFDHNNALWMGTFADNSPDAILLFKDGQWQHTSEQYFGYGPSTIVFDKSGNTWVTGNDIDGTAKFNGENWEYFSEDNSNILSDLIRTAAVDSNGIVWLGTWLGACTFDGENWKYYAASGGVPHYQIDKVVIDDEGNKWIAAFRYGLTKYDGTSWQVFDKTNSGIPSNDLRDIAIDHQGKIWITTDNGLASFDGVNWVLYNEGNTGYPINNLFEIEVDRNGKVWFTTIYSEDFLACFDGINWLFFDSENSILPNNFAGRLGIDPGNKIWLGTDEGLFIYDGISWVNYNTQNSLLPHSWVNSFAFDSAGNSWVGTANGIVRIKGDEWTVFDPGNSDIGGGDIYDITVDKNNNVWTGLYWGLGIAKFDGSIWKHYNKDYLPSTSSYGITSLSIDTDIYNNVWVGSSLTGLIQFNEDKIVAIEEPQHIFSRQENGISIYPNPFNSQTNVSFILNETSEVKISVFSVTGELVLKLTEKIFTRGKNSLQFDAGNLSSGVYPIVFEINSLLNKRKQLYLKKMLLIK